MEQYLKQWLDPAFDIGIDFEAPAAITKDYIDRFTTTCKFCENGGENHLVLRKLPERNLGLREKECNQNEKECGMHKSRQLDRLLANR